MGASSGMKIYIISAIAQIVSFVCGTCLTWFSPIQVKLSAGDTPLDQQYDNSSPESVWMSCLLTVGAIFGAPLFGLMAGQFGRKPILVFLGVPFLVSYLLLAFSGNLYCFLFARAFAGLALGGVFTVIPMYSGEIAEDSNRGMLGAAMNVFICLGLLTSVTLGPYVEFMWFNLILAIFPAIFIVLFFIFCPESPYFLIKKDYSKAEESLRSIRGTYDVSKELSEIKVTVEKSEGGSFMDIFTDRGNRKAFLIGAGLIFFQQFSGINIVLFNGTTIFEAAGGSMPKEYGPIIIALVQFLTSFITPIASDRSGRKILLIISHVCMLVVQIFIGLYFFMQKNDKSSVENYSWLPVTTLVIYITAYNTASGPIPWAVLGELFPSNIKDLAASGASAVCWICGFIITYTYPTLSESIGMGIIFWFFSGCGVFATLFVVFFVIETKGKSLQQIQDELNS
ncbi:facilitated trehalose transporter Tret1-like [Coccinella septempunctata]|uniref:facilitated trehalose transporter Tret1-like n=1 Tax=Coccinella septempunctata TaxID=41139 RepID=UPI001D079EBD|nr:facilitated trehalose transporter Tret1-like [Coccinella septempunctata]